MLIKSFPSLIANGHGLATDLARGTEVVLLVADIVGGQTVAIPVAGIEPGVVEFGLGLGHRGRIRPCTPGAPAGTWGSLSTS